MSGAMPSPDEKEGEAATRSSGSPDAMGSAVLEWRRRRGMTQRAVAARGGISENHVGKLERGEVSDPGLLSVVKVARALDVSVAPFVLAFAGRRGISATGFSHPPEQRLRGIAPAIALGATLRALRRRMELSQAALAEDAGLASPTLSRLEVGSKKDPALRTLLRIADALSRADGSMCPECVLLWLTTAFAHESELPAEALRWLRRRGHTAD